MTVTYKNQKRTAEDLTILFQNNRDLFPLVAEYFKNCPRGHVVKSLIADNFKYVSLAKKLFYKQAPQSKMVYHKEVFDGTDMEAPVCLYDPRDLNKLDWDSLNSKFLSKSSEEKSFLLHRGVTEETIKRFNLISIADLPTEDDKIKAGASAHAFWNNTLPDPVGVVAPIYDQGSVIGAHTRFLNLLPRMKFTSSIPNFFNYHNIEEEMCDELWICEGIYDGYAFHKRGYNFLSPSSGYFSLPQTAMLMDLFINKYRKFPRKINIIFDRDSVGACNAYLLFTFLSLQQIPSSVEVFLPAEECKDPAEHFEKYGKDVKDFVPTKPSELPKKFMQWKRHDIDNDYEAFKKHRLKQAQSDAYSFTKTNNPSK